VDLRDETLALQLQVKPKDFSLLAPRVPIVISGTLGAPAVGVDGKRLAVKALGALALAAAVAPAAALLPLVDAGSSGAGDPCVSPSPTGDAAGTAASPKQPAPPRR
jgi:AsmA family protein